MHKSKKTLFVMLLSILSLTGCPKEKPDAWLCTFVLKEPLEASYNFCGNLKTLEEIRVPVTEMIHCPNGDACKWVTTDQQSYESIREFCWSKK